VEAYDCGTYLEIEEDDWENVAQLITTTTQTGSGFCGEESGTKAAYYIGWSAEFYPGSKSFVNGEIRVSVDGTTVIVGQPWQEDYSGYSAQSGFRVLCLATGVHTINLDARNYNGDNNDKSRIRRARISLFKFM